MRQKENGSYSLTVKFLQGEDKGSHCNSVVTPERIVPPPHFHTHLRPLPVSCVLVLPHPIIGTATRY